MFLCCSPCYKKRRRSYDRSIKAGLWYYKGIRRRNPAAGIVIYDASFMICYATNFVVAVVVISMTIMRLVIKAVAEI